jgi:hypothetical protein
LESLRKSPSTFRKTSLCLFDFFDDSGPHVSPHVASGRRLGRDLRRERAAITVGLLAGGYGAIEHHDLLAFRPTPRSYRSGKRFIVFAHFLRRQFFSSLSLQLEVFRSEQSEQSERIL